LRLGYGNGPALEGVARVFTMNIGDYTLLQLSEECIEVAHTVHKALRFGLDDACPKEHGGDGRTNREKLVAEISDLQALINLVGSNEHIRPDPAQVKAKYQKVAHWMKHSRAMGKLGL
jgi:hypothetical protein